MAIFAFSKLVLLGGLVRASMVDNPMIGVEDMQALLYKFKSIFCETDFNFSGIMVYDNMQS